MGRSDASYGLFLQGKGHGTFEAIRPWESGFSIYGEIRDIAVVQGKKGPMILVSRNNATTRLFNYSIR